MARAHTEKAITTLVEALDSPDERTRIQAASAVLDRAWGKPNAEVTVNNVTDPLGLAAAREAAQEVLRDPEARAGLRAALRGESNPAGYVVGESASSTQDQRGVIGSLAVSKTVGPGSSPGAGARATWVLGVLQQHRKVAICGGPRVGKTTLATTPGIDVGVFVLHTDDLIETVPWDDVPPHVMHQLQDGPLRPVRWLLEGVQAARCLRKGLAVDAVIWLDRPHVQRTPKQDAMAKAVRTVFDEWRAANPAVPVLVPPA